jgi:hypothetical protein
MTERLPAAPVEYEITTVNEAGFLRITAVGAYGTQETRSLCDRVAADVAGYAAQRVLIDMRCVAGRVGLFEQFQIGSYAASRIKVRAALISRPDLFDKFGETVALNRGSNGRIFFAEADALRWLLGDTSPWASESTPQNRD